MANVQINVIFCNEIITSRSMQEAWIRLPKLLVILLIILIYALIY